ncbi:uncharacterized protein LOC107270278 [Cephus cinctus]|uniref:Uncharacterized protein LOC107270278 n=1 Tax=Cephus cinctus TaxID=211228 RepID=A0AAJ7C2Z0_CEPCN|nr:uncharacterized protein LOC107270278 [Cephus cinctus]
MYSFNNLSDKKVETNTINEFRNDSAGNYKRPVILSNIALNNNRVSLCKSSASSSINNSESLLKNSFHDCSKLTTTRLSSIEKENIDKLFSIDEDDFGINESSTQIWISQTKNHQDIIENEFPTTIEEFSSLPTQYIRQSCQSLPTLKCFQNYYSGNQEFCREKHEEQLNDDVEEMDDSIIVISSDDSMDNSIIDSCNIFDNEEGITDEANKNYLLNNLPSFPLNYEGEEYIKQEINSSIIICNKNASNMSTFDMENEVIKKIEEANEHNDVQLKSFSDRRNSIKLIKDEITHGFYIKEETLTPSTPEYYQEFQNNWMKKHDCSTRIQSRSFVSDTHENYLSVIGENKNFHFNESKVKSEIDTLETIIKKTATDSIKNENCKRVSRPSMLSTYKRLHPTKMLSNYSCEYRRAFLRKDLQPVIYVELD